MDEYQHHERLTADADFEGGQWIGGEFVYKKRKAPRQQTEEDRLYGYQSSSSDDDGFTAGLGKKKKKKKRGDDSAALHKEVAFVSSGTVAGTSEEKIAVSDKVGGQAGVLSTSTFHNNTIQRANLMLLASHRLLVHR